MYCKLILVLLDLGYVQGMSDLLAPVLYIMDNEVDAFWCFVGMMKKVVSILILSITSFSLCNNDNNVFKCAYTI